MPVTKSGNLTFTDEQYKYARESTSALAYALANGYDLICEGRYYRLRDHHSMVFTPDGKWFWNSENLKGGAIEFIVHYENRTLVEAVLILNDEPLVQERSRPRDVFRDDKDLQRYISKLNDRHKPYQKPDNVPLPQPFELPEKSDNFKRLFAYLCRFRRLDGEIVSELVREKRLYESCVRYIDKGTGEIKYNHNAVFLGLDDQGTPRHAFQRGLNSKSSFKNDIPGSDFNFYFIVPGRINVSKVFAFEAAIDAISHASVYKRIGDDYKTADRISLDGVSAIPLLSYLRSHPTVNCIALATDNDEGGEKAAIGIMKELTVAGYTAENGYNISIEIPPCGKDWNEYLCLMIERLSYVKAGLKGGWLSPTPPQPQTP